MNNEKSVIGACFLDDFGLDTALSILRPEHFGVESYRRLFTIMVDMAENNEPIDIVTVVGENMDLYQVASDALDFVPSSANITYYAEQVIKSFQRRKIKGLSVAIENDEGSDPSELLDKIDAELLKISSTEQTKYTHIHDAVKSATRMQDQKGFLGIRTFWHRFDRQFSGLCPGSLYCVAGRPGMGKTAFSTCLAINVAREKPVAYFTLEMSKEEISTRMICASGRVNITRARNRELDNVESMNWLQASSELSKLPIYIDDSGSMSIAQMRSKARTMKRKHDLGLIIVDYLQLMSGTGTNRQQEIGSISRGLKLLAKDLGIPVVMLSQLNRTLESRTDKRPMLSDLREAGDIEQDCDAVIMLYRDVVYNEQADESEAEAIIRKNRNGSTGFIPFEWIGQYCYYTERNDNGSY